MYHLCVSENYKCMFLEEVAGDFLAYQAVIEHHLENLCQMNINPSNLII